MAKLSKIEYALIFISNIGYWIVNLPDYNFPQNISFLDYRFPDYQFPQITYFLENQFPDYQLSHITSCARLSVVPDYQFPDYQFSQITSFPTLPFYQNSFPHYHFTRTVSHITIFPDYLIPI